MTLLMFSSAMFFAMQPAGPCKNASIAYESLGARPSAQRSGSKTPAVSPQTRGLKCATAGQRVTWVPFGMKMPQTVTSSAASRGKKMAEWTAG
ncbi:uncharacterized protein ColSpa_00710 [Colletotrichum spaethianum]|uniref:Secreted protein n=1 Tax=Colletotrichum spaethianum TaxID=700344 RepID=A0AA37L5W6_9PEZI|nr:uncharacterized protein ColSpa_00710 [Colletotrichum spaethianum]GKT40529.1 hypothetical protein ColSpa_00710 [Colletotrichum spaethianum]